MWISYPVPTGFACLWILRILFLGLGILPGHYSSRTKSKHLHDPLTTKICFPQPRVASSLRLIQSPLSHSQINASFAGLRKMLKPFLGLGILPGHSSSRTQSNPPHDPLTTKDRPSAQTLNQPNHHSRNSQINASFAGLRKMLKPFLEPQSKKSASESLRSRFLRIMWISYPVPTGLGFFPIGFGVIAGLVCFHDKSNICCISTLLIINIASCRFDCN